MRRLSAGLAVAGTLLAIALPATTSATSISSEPTGGAPIVSGGLAPTGPGPSRIPPPPSKHAHGRWLSGVSITEYWPAPESWFVGRLVSAPGIPGLHRIDWLYSAAGLSMEGEGIGLDGQLYHLEAAGTGGWVTSAGKSTSPSTAGAPGLRSGAAAATGATPSAR